MTVDTRRIHAEDEAGRRAPVFAERRTGSSDLRRTAVTHDFATLMWLTAGTMRVELRTSWSLEPGDVLVVPAAEPHRVLEARGAEFWWLGLCVPCLAADAPALLEPFERVRDGATPVARIPAPRRPFLDTLLEELRDPSVAAHPDAAIRYSLLTLIVNEVVRAAGWSSTSSPGDSGIVTATLRYIERHCLEPLTLSTIAAAMGRTPSYITTALTRATGRSAGAWIIAGRMAEARRRLLHSDESVEVVAGRVGYDDVTHFIRLFRRMHGATPAAWRAMQRRSLGSG